MNLIKSMHTQLSNLYPNIQGQLQNKHSSNIGLMKKIYKKYNQQGGSYKLVKAPGLLKLLQHSPQTNIYFPLQNGIVILFVPNQQQTRQFLYYNTMEHYIFEQAQYKKNQPIADIIGQGLRLADLLINNQKKKGFKAVVLIEIQPKHGLYFTCSLILCSFLACLYSNDSLSLFKSIECFKSMQQSHYNKLAQYISVVSIAKNNHIIIKKEDQVKQILLGSNWKLLLSCKQLAFEIQNLKWKNNNHNQNNSEPIILKNMIINLLDENLTENQRVDKIAAFMKMRHAEMGDQKDNQMSEFLMTHQVQINLIRQACCLIGGYMVSLVRAKRTNKVLDMLKHRYFIKPYLKCRFESYLFTSFCSFGIGLLDPNNQLWF